MTADEKNALWNAINRYVETCGGSPSRCVYGNTARMEAVVKIEKIVDGISRPSFMDEALNSGDGSYRP